MFANENLKPEKFKGFSFLLFYVSYSDIQFIEGLLMFGNRTLSRTSSNSINHLIYVV